MNNELSLTGKTALVTGASGGIGSAIVERLIKAGASVALHYHTSEERVLQLQKLYGDNICYLTRADFADTQSVQEVLDDVWSWKQKIDILINNAALIEPVKSIDDISEQENYENNNNNNNKNNNNNNNDNNASFMNDNNQKSQPCKGFSKWVLIPWR